MRVGTSHFVNRLAAIRYYLPYGYTAATLARKEEEGEIHFGPPPLKPGERLVVIDDGTRYAIETEE